MEHLLQKSKCSIFHNIFIHMIFQRCQKALLWSKWVEWLIYLYLYVAFLDSSIHLSSLYMPHMGLVARKPVFGVSGKARFKPVSSATEAS